MGIFVSSAQVNVGYFYANDQAAPTYLTPSVISVTVKVMHIFPHSIFIPYLLHA